jgi:hypothetical protein
MASAVIDALTRRAALAPATIDSTQIDALRPGAPFYAVREGGQEVATWWCVEAEPSRVVVLREHGNTSGLITARVDLAGSEFADLRLSDRDATVVGSVMVGASSLLRQSRKLVFSDAADRKIEAMKQRPDGYSLSHGRARLASTTTPTGPNRAPIRAYRVVVRDPVPWPIAALVISAGLAFPLLPAEAPLRPGTAVINKPRTAAAQITDALGGLLP